jgi:phosphoribosylamine--glycine ligase
VRVLVVGSGGREHALAWRLARSTTVTEIFSAPGNSGTASVGINLPVADTDIDGLVRTATDRSIDLVVVGPEIPLALGLSDRLAAAGIPCFGPSRAAARLESSKSFARDVMDAAGLAGPEYRVFHSASAALAYAEHRNRPLVVKADGLAAGKGVAMCANLEEAKSAIMTCMQDRMFGEAGETVVIEEWLHGPEVSVFGFTDGENLSAVVAATDYKRIGEGDAGPNTGGMGSYGPPTFWNETLAEQIRGEFMLPVIRELASRGSPYRGALYCGLMLTNDGPRVLEFNCRFGDPETQVIMPRLVSDPAEAMIACATGSLDDVAPVEWSDRPVVAIVMVSGGYPGSYETGFEIDGLDGSELDSEEGIVFHAGVRRDGDGSGKLLTSGGRVLACVGTGDSIEEARDRAYRHTAGVSFKGAYYRRDIAQLSLGQPTTVR